MNKIEAKRDVGDEAKTLSAEKISMMSSIKFIYRIVYIHIYIYRTSCNN